MLYINNSSLNDSCKYDAVDVFIPYYSELQYVPAAIDSILWQKDIRTVIHMVNDCSNESDYDLIEQYRKYDNIRWYKTKENVGPYKICNALIAYMETDFLAVHGSDDISLPARFKSAFKTLKEEGSEAYFAAMENFLTPGENHYAHNQDYLKRCNILDSNVFYVNGAMVMKKSSFEYINGFENYFCGADTEFAIRVKKSNIRVSVSNEIVSLRRVHGKSLSRGTGDFGYDSAERMLVVDECNRRQKYWKDHPLEVENFGGLRDIGDILEKVDVSKPASRVWTCSNHAKLGSNCVLGQGVYTGKKVTIGDRVSIQNSVFIPDGVTIEDDVFIGPNCTFTNDKYPPSKGKSWQPIRVCRGASIGASCTILPGVTIGHNALIGAGSVVTKDVAPNSVGWGNPYRENSRHNVIIGIATYPARLTSLVDTIESLYDQADVICVCLNEYRQVPDELKKYDKVITRIPDRNLKDIGKFLFLDDYDGYYFSCDDDLIYPENYVSNTIVKLKEHGGVVSYHGRTFFKNRECKSYYKDCLKSFACLHDVDQDERVQVAGTGVMCFHTDTAKISCEGNCGNADIDMAVYAHENKINLTVLEHKEGWLKHTDKIDLEDTIYSKHKENDAIFTEKINSILVPK